MAQHTTISDIVRKDGTHLLPADHQPYTDKYFIRTRQILEQHGLNPQISMKVFCRGTGAVAGLDEAVAVLEKYSDVAKTGKVYGTKHAEFQNNEPLIVIHAPAQSVVELETLYLGVLSAAISRANGVPEPNPVQIEAKVARLKEIYQDKPIIYFGARHYHWSLDKEIAAAALRGGAVQTSTDIGSSNIGLQGVGTTPHFLTVALGSHYGREQATLQTAQLFDQYMDPAIPRVTLVDTFNREITDALAVAEHFGSRKHSFRIDTCGENIGEGGSLYQGRKAKDPSFRTGTGVTIGLVTNLRNALISNGFGNYTDIFLSSGFGNEEKAKAFMAADRAYRKKTGYSLFAGVGVGELSRAMFCTADIYAVDGRPFSKAGREVSAADYHALERRL